MAGRDSAMSDEGQPLDSAYAQLLDAEEEAFLSKAYQAMSFGAAGGADQDCSGSITFDELKTFFSEAKLRVTCNEAELYELLQKE
eukprot:gene13571-19443_t